jgi:hypothetical protein
MFFTAARLFGGCLAGVIVSWTTLIQRRTPTELRTQASAAGEALASPAASPQQPTFCDTKRSKRPI